MVTVVYIGAMGFHMIFIFFLRVFCTNFLNNVYTLFKFLKDKALFFGKKQQRRNERT